MFFIGFAVYSSFAIMYLMIRTLNSSLNVLQSFLVLNEGSLQKILL